MQKEEPHSPRTTFCTQSANILQEICIKCFLKHNYSNLMGIQDILMQHIFQQEHLFKNVYIGHQNSPWGRMSYVSRLWSEQAGT